MSRILYPCGFVAMGKQIRERSEHVVVANDYLLSETRMLEDGASEIIVSMPEWPIRIDLVAAIGPCTIDKLTMGNRSAVLGMWAKFAVVGMAISPGEQFYIQLACRPEIFMLHQE